MNRTIISILIFSSGYAFASDELLVGTWQDKHGGIFSDGDTSWDECNFKAAHEFQCVSYPKLGDLVLSSEGKWALEGNKLILSVLEKTPSEEIREEKVVLEIENFSGKKLRGVLANGNKVNYKKVN